VPSRARISEALGARRAGGVVSCIYTLLHQSGLAGLICESFAFRVPAPDFALAALKGLAHVAPHAHVMKLHNEHFSRDRAWVQTLDEDPLIAHEVQPNQTVAEMVRPPTSASSRSST
jgi:alpha-beta hydrolase superfamily lysophospholipase